MSTTINEKILEHLVENIEELDSSLGEFQLLFPEYKDMTDIQKMEKMQDYINYLKHIQSDEKMEPDYDKVFKES
jgi:hypothetical protein